MIKERIIQLIELKGIPKEEFYVKIGMTSASFRGNARKTPINSKAIENILSIIEDANPEWLLTGKGSMLKEKQNEIIKSTPILIKSEDKYGDFRHIPIIDIEAAAGNGAINTDYIEVLGYITVPSNSLYSRTATYYAVKSRGDSMFPTIYDKDILVVRVLDRGEWQDIRDEHVYIVVDAQGRTFVKRVKNRLQRGFVVLMSDNLDKVYYPNFTLEANELHFFLYPELRISPHFPNINATYFNRLKDLEDRFDELSLQFKRIEPKN